MNKLIKAANSSPKLVNLKATFKTLLLVGSTVALPALAAGEEAEALTILAGIVISVVAVGAAYLTVKGSFIVFPWIAKAMSLR